MAHAALDLVFRQSLLPTTLPLWRHGSASRLTFQTTLTPLNYDAARPVRLLTSVRIFSTTGWLAPP